MSAGAEVLVDNSAIGLGEDLRLEGPGICGAALLWEDQIVHLVIFSRRLEGFELKAWQHRDQPPTLRSVNLSLDSRQEPGASWRWKRNP